MTRQVAEATDRQEALRQANQEAAACKHHLQALEQAHAAQLHIVDEQRNECLRVSFKASGLLTLQSVTDSKLQKACCEGNAGLFIVITLAVTAFHIRLTACHNEHSILGKQAAAGLPDHS